MTLTPNPRDLHPYPVPTNEPARQRLMAALNLERRRDDPFFGHVVAMAQGIFDAPVAFISLISGDDQRFLRIEGIEMEGTPRTHSMCAYTVAARHSIVSADTHDDPRFRNHPIVAQPPHVRFSASAPVILSSGFCIGTVCAVDLVPHDPPCADQIAQLDTLAAMVARFYEVPLDPDPTDRAAIQTIERDAQEAFLALVGHELRTPLNGIVGLSHCLTPATAEDKDLVGALQSSASHLDAIIENILHFTELRSGDISLSEEETDVAALLQRVAASLETLMQARGKTLSVTVEDCAVLVVTDRAKLELALTCLLDNVLAHGGTRADVTLRVDPDDGVTVTLTDDGPGISEDRIDAIWSAFGIGADLHTRTADGMGLGLPLTRRIVELHGGSVQLDSSGAGLTALLRLPAWRVARGTCQTAG